MDDDGPRTVIVGGGLAALACAVELSSRGVPVTIVERNAHLGGKMNVLREGGFSFDMGPTIITVPEVLRGIIERSGRRPEDEIDLVDLDPQWRCFYEDGTRIDLVRDPAAFAASLDRQFPHQRPGRGYLRFLDYSRRMYRLSERVFFYRDVGSVLDVMRATRQADPALLRDAMGMRLHSTVGATVRHMIPEPHVRQMVEHFMQYVGSSPFLAPAVLSLIASAQVDHGCWYPMGGTRQVARTLEQIAREQGVEVLTGVGVRRIVWRGDRAEGVELDDGRHLAADAVVSNCDVQRTSRDLVGGERGQAEQRRIAGRYEPACSGVVLYLGLSRRYDHLLHHGFLFSRDSEEEFEDIYERGVPARNPTLYVAAPSRTDPSQAPPGCEALYVLAHTAYLRDGHDWQHADGSLGPMFREYRRIILHKLKRFGMEDIERHIVVERHLTPVGIERMYNAEAGAIYGLASHGRLVGGFKPRNRSRVLRNLYLAGGSANPGPGVPMVLMSGVTAARALAEDFGLAPAADAAAPAAEPVRPRERAAV